MGNEKVAALRALHVPGLPRFGIAEATDASAKDIYFIRHGEAAHNVAPRPWGAELVDAPLTEVGRQQAAELLRPQAAGMAFDVVVVSPLLRAIETATIGLAPHLESGVPFVVVEGCREQLGPNLPDKRRPKHVAAAAYPALDFGAVAGGEDALFTTEREELPLISSRADAFLQRCGLAKMTWPCSRPPVPPPSPTHRSRSPPAGSGTALRARGEGCYGSRCAACPRA